MTTTNLTDTFIRNLAPEPGRQIEIRDTNVTGLILRVSPGGKKTFTLWYRIHGHARRLTLGKYGNLTLAAAREKAREGLRRIAEGQDPAAERQQQRQSYANELFPALCTEYIERYVRPRRRRPRETERLLLKEFVPTWKHLPVKAITRQDVIKLLQGIVDRGAPSTANHALAAIRKMFNWLVDQGHLEASPCNRLQAPSKSVSRDRTLTNDEIRAVWNAATQIGYPYGTIIQLLFLTGQRRGEVAGMRWAELDMDNALWTLPALRTKNGKGHALPLTASAVAVIAGLPRFHDDYVFPARGRTDQSVSGYSKWKHELDRQSGAVGWTVHDIRRTVATNLARLQVDETLIQRIQNQTIPGVGKVYNLYRYEKQMRSALSLWSDELNRILKRS